MADRLIIVMLNTDLDDPRQVSTPLLQATVAASLEYSVEVVLTGRTAELARRGVAEGMGLGEGSGQTVRDLLREAHEAGVTIKVSTVGPAPAPADLIPEVAESVDSTQLLAEAMGEDTRTFTY